MGRESLGFVHRSRTILCRPVPNLSVTNSHFFAAWQVPPTSSVSVEVGSIITLKAVNRFREQVQQGNSNANHRQLPVDMLGKDEFTLAVRKAEDSQDADWEWTNNFKVRQRTSQQQKLRLSRLSGNSLGWLPQGAAPYVELHNPLCDRFQKFFLGLYNNNRAGGSAKVRWPHSAPLCASPLYLPLCWSARTHTAGDRGRWASPSTGCKASRPNRRTHAAACRTSAVPRSTTPRCTRSSPSG
jgi:hypothetical protein